MIDSPKTIEGVIEKLAERVANATLLAHAAGRSEEELADGMVVLLMKFAADATPVVGVDRARELVEVLELVIYRRLAESEMHLDKAGAA